MRSVPLQNALVSYVEAAAAALGAELAAGAEIPFDLEQQAQRGYGGPALAYYRPLTGEFISARRTQLEAMPEHAAAIQQLAGFEGLDRYLLSLGAEPSRLDRSARARAALFSLLAEVFAGQSDFELRPERLRTALERLHCAALAEGGRVVLLASLHGLTITSPELPLTGGLTIARADSLEGLPAGAAPDGRDGAEQLLVVLRIDGEEPREAIAGGRAVLRDLLRALRLFGDGRVTLGALAWARVGEGSWQALPMGTGGSPHGMLVVTPEQEDELRAFCNLVSRRAPDGDELAWALRRFELGCEREDPLEALSDHLLALRALLEPEGPASGMLPGRLAALCATPERRRTLTERVVAAIALERATIAGTAAARAGALSLARETSDHLRALLRDVICGHLDADLAGLADELLLAEPTPASPAAEPAQVLDPAAGPIHAVAAPSEAQLLGDASEAEEVLDLLI